MTSVPPVTRDGFAFANGDLYAEVSGHNRHRRATLAELKTHFDKGSDKDHPAHWFEAQLIHYGLPPSKTKAVARMRLFDAVKVAGDKGGTLKVPAHVSKLEGELKKEWTKLDREAKKALKSTGGTAGPSTATIATKKAGTKRKAEESVDVTVNVAGINITVSKTGTAATSSATQSSSKKIKTTAATTPKATAPKAAIPKGATKATATPKTTTTKAKAAPKSATPRTATPSKSVKEKATPAKSKTATSTSSTAAGPTQTPKPRTKQTARKSTILPVSALGDDYPTHMPSSRDPVPGPRTKQTARKFSNRPVSVLGHGYHNDLMDVDDEPPPPYSEYSDAGHSSASHGSPVSLKSLGLLNGRYDIDCPYVAGEWPHVGDDFELVLTLAGTSLWGHFNLGIVEGVFLLDQRPFESSHDELNFIWRGRERDGPIMYGDSHRGWIKFLGGGRVEGYLDWMGIDFHGQRVPSQSTTSEISAREMDREWNGYSEREYERENRARWH
ncbi:hypothetical protein PG990_003433 [Apiospora arundinis]